MPCKNTSPDLRSNGTSLELEMEEEVIWVTVVMELINPLDHVNFVEQEMGFILRFSTHCEA